MKKILSGLAMLLLFACQKQPPGCARLPVGDLYCLPAIVGPDFSVLRQATLRQGERQLSLLLQIESDQHGLRVAAISAFGQTLFQASMVDGLLAGGPRFAPGQGVDPAGLLALTQIALFPADIVKRGLGAGLSLIEGDFEGFLRRRVVSGDGKDIVVVSREGLFPTERIFVEIPSLGLEIDTRVVNENEKP